MPRRRAIAGAIDRRRVEQDLAERPSVEVHVRQQLAAADQAVAVAVVERQQALDADRIDQQQAEHQARALRPAELVLVAQHPVLERPADARQLGDREPLIAVGVGEPPGDRDALRGRPLLADRPGRGHEAIEGGRLRLDVVDAPGHGRRHREQRQRADQTPPDAALPPSITPVAFGSPQPPSVHQCVRPSRVAAPAAAARVPVGGCPGGLGLSPRE